MVTDTCYGLQNENGNGNENGKGKENGKGNGNGKGNKIHDHHHIQAVESCLPNLKTFHRKNLFCLDVIAELVR